MKYKEYYCVYVSNPSTDDRYIHMQSHGVVHSYQQLLQPFKHLFGGWIEVYEYIEGKWVCVRRIKDNRHE